MKLFDLAFESDRVQYTEEQFLRKLAMESAFHSNIIGFFKEGLPSITAKFKDYVTSLTFSEHKTEMEEIDHNFAEVQKNKLEQQYLNHRDVVVQIPEGFSGEFLDYVLELNSVGSKLFEQTHQLLSEYRFVLSSIITNSEQRTSLKDLSGSYTRTAAARGELQKRLAKYFADHTSSRARLIDVVPRYRDAKELVRQVRHLDRFTTNKDLEEIKRAVKETVDVITLLEDQVAKDVMTDISPEVVKNIATGAYELARYIDQVVVFYYAVSTMVTCVDLMFKQMKELK